MSARKPTIWDAQGVIVHMPEATRRFKEDYPWRYRLARVLRKMGLRGMWNHYVRSYVLGILWERANEGQEG